MKSKDHEKRILELTKTWRENAESLRYSANQFLLRAAENSEHRSPYFTESYELRIKARTMDACADEVERLLRCLLELEEKSI
jgi:hypothetical protein